MRNISKAGEGTYHLQRANDNPPVTAGEARQRWKAFGRSGKKSEQLEALTDEQFGLCAYSEICPDESGLGKHIEHVVPRSISPELTFDYQNIVMSAIGDKELSGLKHTDVFGGHARPEEFDAEKLVSCLQPDCMRYFAYLSDGRIVPHQGLDGLDRTKAEATIKILNLDCSYLRVRRSRWLAELDELIDEHLEQNMSLPDLMSVCLEETNGKLYPFYSASMQRFNTNCGNEQDIMDAPLKSA